MTNKKNNLISIFIVVLLIGLTASLYLWVVAENEKRDVVRKFDTSSFENQKNNYGMRIIHPSIKEAEGAEIVVYFDKTNGSSKIVNVSEGGETFRRQHTYYFYSVEDFFLIEEVQQWDRPYSVEGRVLLKDIINKYYFTKLDMRYWIDSVNKLVSPASKEFQQKQKAILFELNEYLTQIGKPNTVTQS